MKLNLLTLALLGGLSVPAFAETTASEPVHANDAAKVLETVPEDTGKALKETTDDTEKAMNGIVKDTGDTVDDAVHDTEKAVEHPVDGNNDY